MGEEPSAPGEVFPGEGPVLAVLDRLCGDCHSSAAGDAAGFLFSIEGLRDRGWLLPGSGEASRIAVWLQYGYGGPGAGHSNLDVAEGDYRSVVDFINGMEREHCEGLEPLGRDAAIEAMLSDIRARDPADRPFIRYIGITHASPTAACETYSNQDGAMNELLNGVSLGPAIVLPPLIASAFIHAIDLRDYTWNRPLDLGGLTGSGVFPDAWEALVASARPYAREFAGPEADALKQETGTAVPHVPAHVFVAMASWGDLYHALIGVGTHVAAAREALGVSDAGLLHAGMFAAGGRAGDRVVTRRVQGAAPERGWWTREWVAEASDGNRLRQHPLDYVSDGVELMFELPNGLYAFAIATPDGWTVVQEPSCLGVCDPPFAAENSITCRGCHAAGRLIAPIDEVRAFAEASPASFDAPTLAGIRDRYRPDELAARLGADVARHDAALAQLPASTHQQNLVGQVYHEFWLRPVDAASGAAELGVSVEALRAAIVEVDGGSGRLEPWLTDGSIERRVFRDAYPALACAIDGPRNVPVGCP